MAQPQTGSDGKRGDVSRFPTAEQINSAMSKAQANDDQKELVARDKDVAESQARNGKGAKADAKPDPKGDAVGSRQGTLDVVKPSAAAARIIRVILLATDIKKKMTAFVKARLDDLNKQMEIDKVDLLVVDGVPFRREKSVAVNIGAFTDWRPPSDNTEDLLKLLGVTAEELGSPKKERPAPKVPGAAAEKGK